MRVIVIGAGKVGFTIAEKLSNENNDVIIIDKNTESLRKAEDSLDVLCLKGNGVSTSVLSDAGVENTDLLVAVTNSDEVNMVCCLTAKKLGAKHTAARIRDPQYANELLMLKEEIGLDLVINPEQAAAEEIARTLNFAYELDIEGFAMGRVKMVGIKVTSDMHITGKRLNDSCFTKQSSLLVGVAVRNGEVIIPDGDFEVQENDIIYVIGKSSSIYSFCNAIGKAPKKFKNVTIIGGGRLSYYLTNILIDMGMKVKIIEKEKERCEELTELLPNALIINADGTDEQVMLSENVSDIEVFIAATGIDEENLLSSLLAKQHGVQHVVAKISRTNYINIIRRFGIDNVVCPKLITANRILKYVHNNTREALHTIVEGQAQVIQFIPDESCKALNIPIKSLKLPKDMLIATIVRKNGIVIPRGNESIKKGDKVIIITKHENFNILNELPNGLAGELQSSLRNSAEKFGDMMTL